MIRAIYDVKGKAPASCSATGFLRWECQQGRFTYEEVFDKKEVILEVRNIMKSKSNDDGITAFIEDLLKLSRDGIQIELFNDLESLQI